VHSVNQSPDCALDKARVWARGDCDANGTKAWVSFGGESNGQGDVCMDKDRRVGISVRCCADRDPPARASSAKTCAQLGWQSPRGEPAVCGHSLAGCSNQNPPPATEMRSFADTKQYCEDQGARVCTFDELVAGESTDTGCA